MVKIKVGLGFLRCNKINFSFITCAQEGGGGIMGISERYQCYVYGQCQVGFTLIFETATNFNFGNSSLIQGYSVNFRGKTLEPETCHKTCGKNDDCEWWSWEPTHSMCMLFSNCTESGHPDVGLCPECISGQRL